MGFEANIDDVVTAVRGQLIGNKLADTVKGVGTDSRVDLSGNLFIALKGENFDGHDYLKQAVEKGASAVLVHGEPTGLADIAGKVTIIQVANTLHGLQELARFWRRKFTGKVVGITGSMGKTSTKDFAKTLMQSRRKVFAAKKSFNNHWGVPFTLLQASPEDEVVLVEMGMNHAGELEMLSKCAEPDIVMCTTVGRSHVGHFENGVQGIADAKEEIYLANPKALKLFNYDNEYTLKMFERVSKLAGTEGTKVFSSFAAGAEVSLRATHMTLDGLTVTGHIGGVKGEATIPVFGRQNVVNLMAASSIAFACGLEPEDIWDAMPNCRTGWGRNQILNLSNGAKVLFDAYNSNPDSVTNLIKNLFEIQAGEGGKKVAVFGEMLELGDEASKAHTEIGELLGNIDVDLVLFFGPSAKDFEAGLKNAYFSKSIFISDTYEEELAKKVGDMINPTDVVVMKASRGMKLERVLHAWDPSIKA